MSEIRPATIRQQDRFSRWAPAYGTDGLSGLLARLQWRALAALQPGEIDRFLDVGCGTGAAVRGAARTVEFAVGVDLCPAMIEQARAFTGPMPGAARFLVADAQQLPFPDAAFTVVLCTAAARHFADLPAAVQEMVRVLR